MLKLVIEPPPTVTAQSVKAALMGPAKRPKAGSPSHVLPA